METWSFYSAGIRIARWPAAGTLEWACLDDPGAGVLARAVQ
ncbi:MAG: hypothetical protein ACLVJ8_14090 [Ruthenibacterium lactatiformans]